MDVHANEPEPAAPGEICFAHQLRFSLKKSATYEAGNELALQMYLALPFVFAFPLALMVGRLGLSPFLSLLVIAGGMLGVGAAIAVRPWLLRAANKRRRKSIPLLPRADARLVCIGIPEMLDPFGPLDNVPFEPAVFFGTWVLSVGGWRGHVLLSLRIAALIAACAALAYVPGGNISAVNIVAPIIVVASEAFGAFLWPSYLRIVPGRLELIRYGLFGRGVLEVTRIDLRRARVLVDLYKHYVAIAEPAGVMELMIRLLPDRRRFAYMLFLGALSTHAPPELPRDELLG